MEQKNLILAFALALAVMLGFQLLYEGPRQQRLTEERQTTGQTSPGTAAPGQAGAPAPSVPGAAPGATPATDRPLTRAAVLATGPRVRIDTPTLTGSISLRGGRLDDLVLRNYHTTVDPGSPRIELFSPPGSERPYYADFGWTTAEAGVSLPGADSLWRADGEVLTPSRPLTLTWDNGEGLSFSRTFAVDDHYLFTVTQTVESSAGKSVSLAPYGLVSRSGTPNTLGYFILHEGLIGVLNDSLTEIDYDDIKDKGTISSGTTGGWVGITDKYWMASLVPQADQPATARFVHSAQQGIDKYQADILYGALALPPGGVATSTARLFAGAKEVTLLDRYRDELGIAKFDLAVDFGWFYFLTKPIFLALHWLHGMIGNFGVAILILTVGIKLLFFPLANKSYNSMAKMRKLQPEMLRLRERFGEDRQRLNQEMMALYKKEGANPVSGCLPIVIQIPVFFSLYKVLFVTIEMRHAPFFGWIQDLSAPDPTTILNLFGLLPWARPELGVFDLLNLGIWPLLMGLTMFFQQRLNPQPTDPVQAKVFLFMPIIFTFLLAAFPAGLVIYWTWNNALSILQQVVIMKRAGVPLGNAPMAPAAPPAGTRPAAKVEKAKSKGRRKAKGAAEEKAEAGE